MADRSHLTPTTIVDRRGRLTTVFRNLRGRRSPAAPAVMLPGAPAVAAPLAPTARQGTPQPSANVRGVKEMRAFLAGVPKVFTALHPGDGDLLRSKEGRATVNLAMDLIESRAVPRRGALWLLDDSLPGDPGAAAADALRIAATVWQCATERSMQEEMDLVHAIANVLPELVHGPGAGAGDQIASLTAVASFTFRMRGRADLVDIVTAGTSERHLPLSLDSAVVRNRHLDALLRERPEDLDRIIAYIEERGMDTEAQAPVDALHEYLDAEAPAVADGWR